MQSSSPSTSMRPACNDSPETNPIRKPKYPFGYCKPPITQERTALREIGNTNLRRILSDEISSQGPPESTRRVYSQPLFEGTPKFLVPDLGKRPAFRGTSLNSRKPFDYDEILRRPFPAKKQVPYPAKDTEENDASSDYSLPDSQIKFSEPPQQKPIATPPSESQNKTFDANDLNSFSTSLLAVQTHKTSSGQLSILPQSRSLLIDFREGERRRGGKGHEVLVVSADGLKIHIYSAPHLSSPCCLVESIAEYALPHLPQRYHRLYKEAARIIDQLKERTPKVVMYMDTAKCSLMANESCGNIEIIFDSSNTNAPLSPPSKKRDLPRLRLRLKRRLPYTLEVTQSAQDDSGASQAAQKTIPLPRLDDSDSVWSDIESRLDSSHCEGIYTLRLFHKICMAIENVEVPKAGLDKSSKSDTLQDVDSTANEKSPSISYLPPNSTPTVIAPRPASKERSTTLKSILRRKPSKILSPSPSTTTATFKTKDLDFESLLKSTDNVVQTRFKDGVGWCIRSGSMGAHGGRYKIMFADGAILEVDADDEWVEFKDGGRRVSRMAIQDCVADKRVGNRLKAFAEFVSMFDNNDS